MRAIKSRDEWDTYKYDKSAHRTEGKRLFGRHRHRWAGKVKKDLAEIGDYDVD
jgi:hypothetical protein